MMTVHIPWSPRTDSIPIWNEITASIVEHFGLPGGKYTTEITADYMNFHFNNEHDSLLCQILVSEYI